VKVGYRQASYKKKAPAEMLGFFFVCRYYSNLVCVGSTAKSARRRRSKNVLLVISFDFF
jgi:hypothetical protein